MDHIGSLYDALENYTVDYQDGQFLWCNFYFD